MENKLGKASLREVRFNQTFKQISQLMALVLNCQFPYLNSYPNWSDLCVAIDTCTPKLSIKVVQWQKPSSSLFKLYVDGCSKGNTGRSGGGGILRDHCGLMVMAFSKFYGQGSNNVAGAKAILTGVQMVQLEQLYAHNY